MKQALRDLIEAGFDPKDTEPDVMRSARVLSVGLLVMLCLSAPYIVVYASRHFSPEFERRAGNCE